MNRIHILSVVCFCFLSLQTTLAQEYSNDAPLFKMSGGSPESAEFLDLSEEDYGACSRCSRYLSNLNSPSVQRNIIKGACDSLKKNNCIKACAQNLPKLKSIMAKKCGALGAIRRGGAKINAKVKGKFSNLKESFRKRIPAQSGGNTPIQTTK